MVEGVFYTFARLPDLSLSFMTSPFLPISISSSPGGYCCVYGCIPATLACRQL